METDTAFWVGNLETAIKMESMHTYPTDLRNFTSQVLACTQGDTHKNVLCISVLYYIIGHIINSYQEGMSKLWYIKHEIFATAKKITRQTCMY